MENGTQAPNEDITENHTQAPLQMVEVNGNMLPKQGGKFVANWTREQVNQLVDLWYKGYPCRVIGNEVGKTKNAVIGKAHRLKLEPRDGRNQYSDKIGLERQPPVDPDKNKVMKLRKPPKFFAEEMPINTNPISMLELTPRTCRAIVGKDNLGIATYCGRLTYWDIEASRYRPYCKTHYESYYYPNRKYGKV